MSNLLLLLLLLLLLWQYVVDVASVVTGAFLFLNEGQVDVG